MIYDLGRKSVYQENDNLKSFIPKFKWHGGMSEQGNSHLYNVPMLTLSGPIFLVSVRTGDKMVNSNLLEKGIQGLILPSPIRLHSKNFLVKLTFYQVLKITETLKYIRFMANQINPDKLGIIINKANIVVELTN